MVIYRGPPAPRLLFVGEAPGKEEDARGVPFVGRSGRVLDAALANASWPPDAVGVTNVVMCRPPGNRLPPGAVDACHDWLEQKIRLLDPSVVATLGGTALRALVPGAPRPFEAAGRWFSWEGRPVFALLHPAATLRSRRFSERWDRDWETLRTALPTLSRRVPGAPGPRGDPRAEKPYNRPTG